MKKNKLANLGMVLIIAAILISGILIAVGMRPQEQNLYGSEYRIQAIPDNRLVTNGDTQNLCTITIRCDTIFDNGDKLDPAKAVYVPADGEVLPVTTVEFTPGETVFDVLSRVCQAADIQLEYSWTPLYDSYYIEGINHLYEFDCGYESGWMYRVDGWFPNYGCSAHTLQGGEEIVWYYTCVGLGTDVGAEREVMQ